MAYCSLLWLMFFVFLSVCFVMLVYPNSLMYCMCLIFMSSSLLIWMMSQGLVSLLVLLLVILVYAGAVMILVGYVCAVSPNLVMTPTKSIFWFFFSLLAFFFPASFSWFFCVKLGSLGDYFLSEWGLSFFVIVAIMLFVVLLMVTSQFFFPQGPFRSK